MPKLLDHHLEHWGTELV